MTEITERLHLERDALSTSDVEEGLRRVRRTVRRRRRRNALVGAGTASGLLVAGIGAAGLIGSDNSEVVVTDTAPSVTTDVDDEEAETSAVPVASPPGTTETIDADPAPETEPVLVIPSVGETLAGIGVEAEPVEVTTELSAATVDDFSASWQVPWKGGFLVGSTGIDDSPWPVAFSADGLVWEALELDPGIGDSSQAAVTADDRLVFLSARWDGSGATPVIASTTDLENWVIEDVPIARPPADLPDIVEVTTWPRSIAVNESGWIITVENTIRINTRALVEQRTGRPVTGLSEAQSAEGIRLDVDFDDDGDRAVLDITWAELEGEVGSEILASIRGPQPPEVWTGSWADTTPVRHDIPTNEPESWIDTVVAADDGFVVVRNIQESQPNAPAKERKELVAELGGNEWIVLDAPVDGSPVSVFPLDGDVGVIVEGTNGTITVHRVDIATQTWTPIEIPSLPATARYSETSDTAAVQLDTAPQQQFDTEPTTGTVEQDGLRYTWTFDSPISSYEVVSIESGEVLVAESIDISEVDGSFELAFEHLVGGIGDTTISDPATGDVLMEISAAEMDAANPPISADNEWPEPDPWILASADGNAWYAQEAPPFVPDKSIYFTPAATVSGTRLLIRTSADEYFVVDLA